MTVPAWRAHRPGAGAALGLIALAAALILLAPPKAIAAFGFLPGSAGLSVAAVNQNESPTTQAGAHPFALRVGLGLETAAGASDGDLRDLDLALPPGFLANPTAVPECSQAAFHTARVSPNEASLSGESCPSTTQVGVAAVDIGGTVRHFGVFNLVPPDGAPAAVGLSPSGVPIVLSAHLREADAGLSFDLTDLPRTLDLQGLQLTIWGSPWVAAHDSERGNCLNEQTGGSYGACLVFDATAAAESLIKSYLTMPTTPCGPPLAFTAGAGSWEGAEAEATASVPGLENCNASLSTAKVQLTTDAAASGTGLAFNLSVNDGGGILNPGGIARPAIKQVAVSLPQGLTINPSIGAGLQACSEADFARESATSAPGAGCPNPTKVGDVSLEGALGLAKPLQGSLFIATPYRNPFGTLLAVYIVARDPRRGLLVKSIGKLEPDPATGRLVVTFDDLPRLLYEHFSLDLREGQRSVLVSPPLCGSYATDLALSSWAEPAAFRHESTVLAINRGQDGGACPSGGLLPFHPGLLAGSINPQAGAYTPFYLRMTRTDAEQEITSYSATFPPGLLAKLTGVGDCPEAAIAAAKTRTGAAELATPSCPASSQIGRTLAGYGLGGTLAYAPGNLYLAGPYHGAPLSVVAIDAALIGPFDLGTVVVRSAIRLDPVSAEVSIDSAGSDPIPHILAGIPLQLRDIRVYIDRPGFTVNPTSCDPAHVLSTLTGAGTDLFGSADDDAATSTQRFQLLNCPALGFKPRLAFSVGNATRHGDFPSLHATYTARPGDANLSAVTVTLPPSLFVEQAHIGTVCTMVQFRAEACPPGSRYGWARAQTPLLAEPVEGPVYMRSSRHAVPDVVASLHGRGVAIEVAGRIDSSHGGIRARFNGLADAPVSKFTMTLDGGRKGLLVNAEDLCLHPSRVNVRFVGHNNATAVTHPRIATKCKRRGKSRGGRG